MLRWDLNKRRKKTKHTRNILYNDSLLVNTYVLIYLHSYANYKCLKMVYYKLVFVSVLFLRSNKYLQGCGVETNMSGAGRGGVSFIALNIIESDNLQATSLLFGVLKWHQLPNKTPFLQWCVTLSVHARIPCFNNRSCKSQIEFL